MKNNYPSVAIIILNWNGLKDTKECIESLRNINYNNFQIIIIDNASKDNSYSYLKSNYSEFIVLKNSKNLGFAGGNNVGIRRALADKYDYILILNNDTIVYDKLFLDNLVKEMEKDVTIGFACPTIEYDKPKGRIWYAGGNLSLNWGWKHYYEISKGKRYCTFATACCLLARSKTISDIGMFNESYFFSVEDVEWSKRALNKRWKIAYVPNAKIIHKDSNSSKNKIKGKGFYTPFRVYYEFRNSIWLIREYANIFQKIFIWSFIFSLRFFYKVTGYVILGRWEKLMSIIKALKDGVFTSSKLFKNYK